MERRHDLVVHALYLLAYFTFLFVHFRGGDFMLYRFDEDMSSATRLERAVRP